MVILHGAGSRKENHGDFGRAAADAGWAALAYDQRGHGDSTDEMGPGALADIGVMARMLADHDGVDEARVCVRGSSMGGYLAIHAAATSRRAGRGHRHLPGGGGGPAPRAPRGRAGVPCGPRERERPSMPGWPSTTSASPSS